MGVQVGSDVATQAIGRVVSIVSGSIGSHGLLTAAAANPAATGAGAGAGGGASSAGCRAASSRSLSGAVVVVATLRLLRTAVGIPSLKMRKVMAPLMDLCLGPLRSVVSAGAASRQLQPPYFVLLRDVVQFQFRYFVTTGPPNAAMGGERARLFTSATAETYFQGVFEVMAGV